MLIVFVIVVQIRKDIYVCLCSAYARVGIPVFCGGSGDDSRRRNTNDHQQSPHRHKTPALPTRTHTTHTDTYIFFHYLVDDFVVVKTAPLAPRYIQATQR